MYLSLHNKSNPYEASHQDEFTNYDELLGVLKKEHTDARLIINSEDIGFFQFFMSELKSTKIKSFDIECGNLSDADTAIVLTEILRSQVENINFNSIKLGKASEAALHNFLPPSKLKSLTIQGYEEDHVGITDVQMTKLIKALPRDLNSLELSFVNMGDSVAIALAEILPSSNLKNLTFGQFDSVVTQKGINTLIEAIPSSQLMYLQLLDVKEFGDKNAVSLAKILPESKIVTLELNYCYIGDIGALALLNTLQNSKVKDLDLNNNNIGPEIADFFNNMQRPLELRKLDLSDNPIGDKGVLALAKASKFLHIDYLHIDRLDTTQKAQAALLTALKDNYAIEELKSDYFRDCDYSDLNSVLNRNINLKLLAKKFNNNEYLSADEIQPLLKVIADVSIDVAYIKKARERMYLATEFLGNNPTKLRATLPFDPTELYKGYLDRICDGGSDSLALTVTNLYFKNSIKISDKNIAAKIFDLLLNSGELKPALKNPHTALFIADKLNDQSDARSNADKIESITVNLKMIHKSNNAVEFFKAHPSKIGGFLVMPTEKLESILTSVFENKYVRKELARKPNLLFEKNGIKLLEVYAENTELKAQLEVQTADKKRSGSFADKEENKAKSARSML